jgi:hypothetical protein
LNRLRQQTSSAATFVSILLDGDSKLVSRPSQRFTPANETRFLDPRSFILMLSEEGPLAVSPISQNKPELETEIKAFVGKESAYALSTAVYQLCLENLPDGIIPNCFTVQVFLK